MSASDENGVVSFDADEACVPGFLLVKLLSSADLERQCTKQSVRLQARTWLACAPKGLFWGKSRMARAGPQGYYVGIYNWYQGRYNPP